MVDKSGWAKLPSRLLFSQDGLEVYANTFPNGRADFLTQISENGLEVLIVYQDEAVRQGMIKQLREDHALPPPGMGALADNLKYAVIHFMPEWLPSDLNLGNKMGNPFARKWSVWHIEYDQPSQCQNVIQNDVHPSLFNPYPATVEAIAETNPNKNARLPPNRFAIWSKSLEAMLAWAKESASLVDR